jgi:hypothetical protein
MLSLKVFDRSNSNAELLEAYRQAAVLILESLTQHGPAGDESDYDSFRVSIGGVIEKLEAQNAKPSEINVAAGVASTAIQEYNRQTVSSVRARGVELQAVVGMLTQCISEISAGSERSTTRLRDIERRLAKSQEIYDVRDLRQEMADCLADVREESACRRRESDHLIADLKTAVREGARTSLLEIKANAPENELEPPAGAPAEDAESGPRGGIEALIEQAAQDGPPLFVAVLVIDHLNTIISRFGQAAAAQVAAFCAQQAKTNLRNALEVLVWKGTSCVALLDGTAGSEALERGVLYEAQRRRSMTLELGQRNAMLQVSYSKWCVFPVTGRQPSAVMQGMSAFLTQATARP